MSSSNTPYARQEGFDMFEALTQVKAPAMRPRMAPEDMLEKLEELKDNRTMAANNDAAEAMPVQQEAYAPQTDSYDETYDDGEDDIGATDAESSAGRKGRPRSEKSRKAILKAVNALLLRMSVQDLSIEAIAKKAKVGKTTIYRWWPNKTAVVMDALVNQPGMNVPLPNASNNAEAVEMLIDKLVRLLSSPNGPIIAQLFSEAQADEKSLEVFEQSFLAPLTDAIQYSIEAGKEAGEFRRDLETDIAVDMVCGPVFFRLMAHPNDLGIKFQTSYPAKAWHC
ncbi:MAG: TetR/AcrR family transcriptional regulator [Alphaproteobacteria bacterium]|nr:TetR/AcrR family transcriptional regulator [Alphaproteobacteria bacterium]